MQGSSKDANAPWSLRVSVIGAKDLPQLDMFGASDPYACISVFLVEGWDKHKDKMLSALEHNVSKMKRRESLRFDGSKPVQVLTPQRRTRIISQCLKPVWREVFQFDGARHVKIDNGVVTYLGSSLSSLCGKTLMLMISLHDYDFGR
jgi:hypothetical protein